MSMFLELPPMESDVRINQQRSPGHLARTATVLAACLLVAACAKTDFDDLEKFVEETRLSQKGRIDPLPEFTPGVTYAYAAGMDRDPFTQWRDETGPKETAKASSNGIAPDLTRRKEALEGFPLDSLRMVGTLARDDGEWAVIRAPDGLVHRVKPGNYVGQNHGKIVALGEDGLQLQEIVPDGLGGWQQREATLTLVE